MITVVKMNNFDKIPSELKVLKQWVLWGDHPKDGTPKTPLQTNGKTAKSNEPKTWNTFENVLKAFKNDNDNGKFKGIGFVISKDDSCCGIDLDDCRDSETGIIKPQFLKIVDKLKSYTEISPSGKGLHIICKLQNNRPYTKKINQKPFEFYPHGQYLTFTGNVLNGYETIEYRDKEVREFYDEKFEKEENNPKITTSKNSNDIVDLIKSKIRIESLVSDYGVKIGRNNKGLCPFHKEKNPSFTIYPDTNSFHCFGSGCEKHGDIFNFVMEKENCDFKTALKILADKAGIDICNKKNNRNLDKKQIPKQINQKSPYFDGSTFIPKRLADELMSENHYLDNGVKLYQYNDGVYKEIRKRVIEKQCSIKLGEDSRIYRINEVYAHICRENHLEIDMLDNHVKKNVHLINVLNGMLDIKSMKLLAHDPKYFSVIQIPVIYDPSAKCNNILKFFNETLFPDCLDLIGEMFGLFLIPYTKFKKAFMLYGDTDTGKTTFLNLIHSFIGFNNVSAVSLHDLIDDKFKRVQLLGKLLNIYDDLKHTPLNDTGLFKAITGGGVIDAEYKGIDPFKFKPFARLIYSTNKLPPTKDFDKAYLKRWIIIHFPNEITNKIDDIESSLTTQEELSGLLNFALEGLKRFLKNKKFSIGHSIQTLNNKYEKESNPMKSFVDERCELNPDYKVKRTGLYNQFKAFCNEKKLKMQSNQNFYSFIRNLTGVNEDRDGKTGRYFTGIRCFPKSLENIDHEFQV